MAINPNIALSYRAPEFASPVQMANQMMAFKAAQRENQLAEMQMAEAQRKREQAEQLNALYAGALDPNTGQLDYNRLRSGMASGGFGAQIPGVIEEELKGREQRGKAGKAEADAFTAAMGASKSNLRLDMSPEEYLAWHENNHRDPIIGPYLARLGVTSDTTRPKIIEAINTGRLPDLIKESALGIDKMTEQHFVEQGLGGTSRVLAIPKRGGKAEVVPGSEAAITPSPNAPKTIIAPGPKAEAEAWGEQLVKDYGAIRGQAETARKALNAIDKAENVLNTGFETGAFGTARAAANNVAALLGVKDAELAATSAQQFLAQGREALLDRQFEQKGPQTENDARRIEQTFVNLGNTTEANRFLLASARVTAKRAIARQNFYAQWRRKEGTLEGADEAWEESEGGKSIFDYPELAKYKSAPAAAPAATPAAPAAGAGAGAGAGGLSPEEQAERERLRKLLGMK